MQTLRYVFITIMLGGLAMVGISVYAQNRLISVIGMLTNCRLEAARMGLGEKDPIPDTPTCNTALKANRELPGWIVNVPPWRSR